MKDLVELLDRVSRDFVQNRIDYQQKHEQVNNIDSFSDLERLNELNAIKKRLAELYINPKSNPISLERIIGKNCLMDLNYFKKGLEVAKTVCRVVENVNGDYFPCGTGFLVGPGLLMTNNHVIRNIGVANTYLAEFEYEKGLNNIVGDSFLFQLDPASFFHTNERLDYSIVGVESISRNDPNKNLDSYSWNQLKSTRDKVICGEAVSIIQHPEGKPKMIAIRENKVVEVGGNFIHYTTDTEPGSSGSLVANDQWEIVALHRAGVYDLDDDGNILLKDGTIYKPGMDTSLIKYVANQGVLMDDILIDISKQNLPTQRAMELKQVLLNGFQPMDEKKRYNLPESR